jgi:glutamyl-tRNA reductase
MLFFCCGIHHKTTPLHLRELIHLKPHQVADSLAILARTRPHVTEVAILSTCNRLEIYGVIDASFPDDPLMEAHDLFYSVQRHWERDPGGSLEALLRPHVFFHAGEPAARHLLQVVASLDSMMVGETQITGQFKDAMQMAQEQNTLGPTLRRLCDHALRVSKVIRNKTEIGSRPVSLGHAAFDLVARFFTKPEKRRLLLLGSGQMATLTARHCVQKGLGDVTVLSRTIAHAQALIADLGKGVAGSLSALGEKMTEVDIVISAVDTHHPIITQADVRAAMSKRRISQPLLLIDLSVPRSIEAGCEQLEQVFSYDLDDLQQCTNENKQARERAVEHAETYIEQAIQAIQQQDHSIDLNTTLASLNRYVKETWHREWSRVDNAHVDPTPVQATVSWTASRITADFAVALKSASEEDKRHFVRLLNQLTSTQRTQDSSHGYDPSLH